MCTHADDKSHLRRMDIDFINRSSEYKAMNSSKCTLGVGKEESPNNNLKLMVVVAWCSVAYASARSSIYDPILAESCRQLPAELPCEQEDFCVFPGSNSQSKVTIHDFGPCRRTRFGFVTTYLLHSIALQYFYLLASSQWNVKKSSTVCATACIHAFHESRFLLEFATNTTETQSNGKCDRGLDSGDNAPIKNNRVQVSQSRNAMN